MFFFVNGIRSKGPNLDQSMEKISKVRDISLDDKKFAMSLISSGDSKHYSLLDDIFGENNDRITWTVPNPQNVDKECIFRPFVAAKLSELGYTIIDYIKGTCRKDNRITKIGKVLTKANVDPEIINGFSNSSQRMNSNKDLISVTLSRNPFDIVAMSTGRGWRSCMSMDRGNRHYVGADIMNDTMIVYYHKPDDMDINEPFGRNLIKKYQDFSFETMKNLVFYKHEKISYGSVSEKVGEFARLICDRINDHINRDNDIQKITGLIGSGVYCDYLSNRETYVNYNKISLKDLLETSSSWDRSVFETVLGNIGDHTPLVEHERLIDYLSYEKIKPSFGVFETLVSYDTNSAYSLLDLLSSNSNTDDMYIDILARRLATHPSRSLFEKSVQVQRDQWSGHKHMAELEKSINDSIYHKVSEVLYGKLDFRDMEVTHNFLSEFFTTMEGLSHLDFDNEEIFGVIKEVLGYLSNKALPNDIAVRLNRNSYNRSLRIVPYVKNMNAKIIMYDDLRHYESENEVVRNLREEILRTYPNKSEHSDTDYLYVLASRYRSIVQFTGDTTSNPIKVVVDDNYTVVV